MDLLPKRSDRGLTWTPTEEMELLDIWSDDQISEQLAAGGRNMHIFIAISDEMARRGVNRTPEQCRIKLKRFKMLYNQAKKSPQSLKEKKAFFKYYEKVDEILSWPCRGGSSRGGGDSDDLSNDNSTGDLLKTEGASSSGWDYFAADMFHARAWTAQEVEVLLDIWQDPIIRETLVSARDPLDGCTQISDTMGDSGYVRTAMECRNQMKKLKTMYINTQQQLDADPHYTPSFPYHKEMRKIMNQPLSAPARRKGRVEFKRKGGENSHSSSEETTGSHAMQTGSDVMQTGSDAMQTGSDAMQTGSGRRSQVRIIKYEDDDMEDEEGEDRSGGWGGNMVLDCQDATSSNMTGEQEWGPRDYQPQKPKNYWSQEEAEALVKVWVANDIQGRLLYKYRNMDVYTDVCKRLAKEGYDRTAEECRCKINALRYHYRNSKPNSNFWAICKQWAHFDDFRRIVDDPNKAGVFRRSQDALNDSSHENSSDVAADAETSGMGSKPTAVVVNSAWRNSAEGQGSLEDHTREFSAIGLPHLTESERTSKQVQPESTKRKRTDAEEDVPQPKRKALGINTRQLMSSMERMINRSVNKLIRFQRECQQKQLEWEEKRLKLTLESETKRQQEQREHDKRLIELFSQLSNGGHCSCNSNVCNSNNSNSNNSSSSNNCNSVSNSSRSNSNRDSHPQIVPLPSEISRENKEETSESFPNLLLHNGDL